MFSRSRPKQLSTSSLPYALKILNFPYHCIILDHTTLTLEKLCQTPQGAWERYYPPNIYTNEYLNFYAILIALLCLLSLIIEGAISYGIKDT